MFVPLFQVLTSWADIVKFGQTKPQTEVATKKKPTKSNIVKKTAVPKPKVKCKRFLLVSKINVPHKCFCSDSLF